MPMTKAPRNQLNLLYSRSIVKLTPYHSKISLDFIFKLPLVRWLRPISEKLQSPTHDCSNPPLPPCNERSRRWIFAKVYATLRPSPNYGLPRKKKVISDRAPRSHFKLLREFLRSPKSNKYSSATNPADRLHRVKD